MHHNTKPTFADVVSLIEHKRIGTNDELLKKGVSAFKLITNTVHELGVLECQ